MTRKTRWIVAGTVATAAVAIGAGGAMAVSRSDDRPLTGRTLDQASKAALAATGGGRVVETEIGDDGAAYGVEVVLPDGSQVEVNLDERFRVIGSSPDDDTGETEDSEGRS